MRILITGAAGFLGSHLCERLLKEGNDILCLDNFFTGNKNNIVHLLGRPHFELIRHDIINPIYLDVDEIYNMACPASPVRYPLNPIKTIKTNVMGAINVLGMAKRTKAKILQASTSEVYGDPDVHPQKESYWGRVNPVGTRMDTLKQTDTDDLGDVPEVVGHIKEVRARGTGVIGMKIPARGRIFKDGAITIPLPIPTFFAAQAILQVARQVGLNLLQAEVQGAAQVRRGGGHRLLEPRQAMLPPRLELREAYAVLRTVAAGGGCFRQVGSAHLRCWPARADNAHDRRSRRRAPRARRASGRNHRRRFRAGCAGLGGNLQPFD